MRVVLLGLLTLLLTGCSSGNFSLEVANSDQPANFVDTVNPVVTDWKFVAEGVEFIQKDVEINGKSERLAVVRIDPSIAELKAAVQEESAQSVQAWAEQLQATVVINAGYFDPKFALTTRTVVDGVSYGPLLSGRTGVARVTSSEEWRISSTDQFDAVSDSIYSVQSYPLLVDDSAVVFSGGSDNVAQRSVVAQGTSGELYVILAEYGTLTLDELAVVLVDLSDLSIGAALNLDGGTSSGLAVSGQDIEWHNASLPVPSVLYIQ